MDQIKTVMTCEVLKASSLAPLAENLVDAYQQNRKDDARFYSNKIILNVPNLPKATIDAVYDLGR